MSFLDGKGEDVVLFYLLRCTVGKVARNELVSHKSMSAKQCFMIKELQLKKPQQLLWLFKTTLISSNQKK